MMVTEQDVREILTRCSLDVYKTRNDNANLGKRPTLIIAEEINKLIAERV